MALALFMGLTQLVGDAQAANIRDAWYAELRRDCPSHHVDWICGDCYDDLTSAFILTLPEATRLKISERSDFKNQCASEQIGFDCEMTRLLDIAAEFGLVEQFARFACHRYKCSEIADCSRRGLWGKP